MSPVLDCVVTPIDELVLKVTARCNINCDYCYEFNLGDESWRSKPAALSKELATLLVDRIDEHARAHSLSSFTIGLHGGEPLLLGPRRLDALLSILRRDCRDEFKVELQVQTNATLITPEMCEVLRRHHVSVGVSIDGSRAANDRHRVDHAGRSTFDATLRGIETLQRHAPDCLDGCLAVLDVENEPLAVLDFLSGLGVSGVDVLLPDHDWRRPPPRPLGQPVAYADWWYSVWKAWVGGRSSELRIRFLEHIVRKIVGADGLSEAMSLDPISFVVVASDGSIESLDALKSNGVGAQNLGMHLRTHSFDDVLKHPSVVARQVGAAALAEKCQRCPYLTVCGGGYLPHRWSAETGYRNPSVYCADLFNLIGRIEADLRGSVDGGFG